MAAANRESAIKRSPCTSAAGTWAEDWKLLILDDLGQLSSVNGDGWSVISTPKRFPSLMAKYQAMLAAEGWPDRFMWDAVALMDDDDISGPHWLSSHAHVLPCALHDLLSHFGELFD